ncbi:DegT/DnrJ/EryC1/StrS family aminotransferase [Candidatus Dojkabacteria bacterium]|jgi:dTDP-4-amino-4,6-dideoxygalactose transaminase|nr:DegT/DnrJ/EryC1/StrS family aminotransferase [Candidatus Dojkabacteria bacterium]
MKIPFVNYKISYRIYKKYIDGIIKECLGNGDLILRKDVEAFENNLAKLVGQKYAVGLNSGTDALFLALKALNIGKGDEVITTSHTFIATIAAIHNVGAKPVLVDIGDDMLMDLERVKRKITKRTKAIIPVHMNGAVVDIKKLKRIVDKIPIIEDSAQACGVKTTANGIIKCFSFYPAKMLGCYGDGGAITTDDEVLSDRIKVLRDNAQKRLKGGEKVEDNLMTEFGYNSRLDNLQAAILNFKIQWLPMWIKRRLEICEKYNKGLGMNWKTPQNYIYTSEEREKLAAYLKSKGIETLVRDHVPNHKHPALKLNCSLPATEKLAKLAIALPLYPELEDFECDYIIKCIKEFNDKSRIQNARRA